MTNKPKDSIESFRELKNRSMCLIPVNKAGLVCHEYDYCKCDINSLIEKIEALEKEAARKKMIADEVSKIRKECKESCDKVYYRNKELEARERRLVECLKTTNQHVIELLEWSEIDKDVAHVWANAEDGMYKAKQCLKELGEK